MTDRGLLQLSAFDSEHHIVVAPLEHLDEYDHFFVLHEIEGASAKVERIGADDVLNLSAQLRHHGLVEMAITS